MIRTPWPLVVGAALAGLLVASGCRHALGPAQVPVGPAGGDGAFAPTPPDGASAGDPGGAMAHTSGRYLRELSVDRATGHFACEVWEWPEQTLVEVLWGGMDEGKVVARGIGLPPRVRVLQVQRWPVSQQGLLAQALPDAHPRNVRFIYRYDPQPRQWVELLRRPLATLQSGPPPLDIRVLLPLAWAPDGQRFLCEEGRVAKLYDLAGRELGSVTTDVWPDFPTFWPHPRRIFFGRYAGTTELQVPERGPARAVPLPAGNVLMVDARTRRETPITQTGRVLSYAVNADGSEVVALEGGTELGHVAVTAYRLDGRLGSESLGLARPGPDLSLTVSGPRIVLSTRDRAAQEETYPTLSIVDREARSVTALADAAGRPLRGWAPRFLSTAKLLFIAPISPNPAEALAWKGESLYVYDFATRCVAAVQVYPGND